MNRLQDIAIRYYQFASLRLETSSPRAQPTARSVSGKLKPVISFVGSRVTPTGSGPFLIRRMGNGLSLVLTIQQFVFGAQTQGNSYLGHLKDTLIGSGPSLSHRTGSGSFPVQRIRQSVSGALTMMPFCPEIILR